MNTIEKLTCPEIDLDRYQVELIDVDDLRPSPENDEIYGEIDEDNDPALPGLIDSIRQMGLEEPIIATLDGFVLSGHRRLYAVRSLGWKRVPVRFANIRRDETADYHRLLAAYNPQRVKSVAAIMAERFIQSENYVTEADLYSREYERTSTDELETMAVVGTKEVEPIGRRKEFLEAVKGVVAGMRNFWPLTVRQVHYRLLNAPPLTQDTKKKSERWRYRNDQASYNKLSNLLVAARYLGHVPMHAIDDPTRTSKDFSQYGWENTTDFISQQSDRFLTGFYRNRREGQTRHVEVLLEKNTLLNIANPVCDRFDVPFTVNRGYGNPSVWAKIEKRWRDNGCKPFVLLSVSDHDPEGFNLVDDAIRSLRHIHQVDVDLVRVAITHDQVADLDLAPNFAKEGSTRFKEYVERTGANQTWECEALDPQFLRDQLEDAILSVTDTDQLNAVVRRENEEKDQLAQVRRRMGPAIMRMIQEGDL